MTQNRRDLLKNGSLALLGTGLLSRMDKVAAQQNDTPHKGGRSLTEIVKSEATGASEKLFVGAKPGEEGPPQPTTDDRLSLDWNKRVVARFKDKLSQQGIQAFLVRDPMNTVYLTGYWHTTTERPEATYMNKDDEAPWFLHPGLDRDLVRGWWYGGGWSYFDYKHGEGSAPVEGKVVEGKTVDLFRYLLEGIKKRGVQGKKIGIDGELSSGELAVAKSVLPGVEWVDVGDTLMTMREVKTPEELALWRRAYVYFDRAHAYARDYVITHGTDITDYEVGTAATLWINDILLSDLHLENGAPHHGVGSSVSIQCRVGPLTSYPHPNQPLYNRIGRNMAMQIEGGGTIGGYGGENYRAFILANANGEFDPHMQKLWEVSQHSCDMQVQFQLAGSTCSSVAAKILKYQVENGVQEFIYHRPAHGEGIEGHQPPYLALGDHTILQPGMCFSEEPGLYDQKSGCGFNWSDTVVTAQKTAYRMSRVPYSKEYCWLKL